MPLSPLKYRSGEEIKKGDRVLFRGEPGTIELVVVDFGDAEANWHMETHGGGMMIIEPKFFGRAFIPADQIDETEDLEFVSRAPEQ
ncbi:MAG: hypothetical protein WA197_24040 [Candidatus Acidiferrales bacterium]